MQFLGDYFKACGLGVIYAAPDHIKWVNKKAFSIIKGQECEIDGIVRFFPLEWLVNLPKRSGWQGYYDSETPSCNNPAAIFAQSKRLPLIWDSLGVEIPAWKNLLPQTCDPELIQPQDEDWIYKPALGRVGEGISIKEAVTPKEFAQINKAARKNPKKWAAQRRFKSLPVPAKDGVNYHVCIGVFTVDGKNSGFYGRISPYPRIDANAIDIPILISKEGEKGD
jgi:glutathionylspermidine synthase